MVKPGSSFIITDRGTGREGSTRQTPLDIAEGPFICYLLHNSTVINMSANIISVVLHCTGLRRNYIERRYSGSEWRDIGIHGR